MRNKPHGKDYPIELRSKQVEFVCFCKSRLLQIQAHPPAEGYRRSLLLLLLRLRLRQAEPTHASPDV